MCIFRVLSIIAVLTVMSSARAADEAGVSVRLGMHGRFDRILVSVPEEVHVSAVRKDDEEVVQFNRRVQVDSPGIGPRPGILSLQPSADGFTIRLKPGSVVHKIRLAGHLVLDVFAPVQRQRPSRPPAVVAAAGVGPTASDGTVLPGLPSPMVAVVDRPVGHVAGTVGGSDGTLPPLSAVPAVPAPQPRQTVLEQPSGRADDGPVSIAAAIVPASNGKDGGLLLPLGRKVGVAAFRRGNQVFVVLDSSKPVDLAPVAADPMFGRAAFSLLDSGAVLTVPVAAAQQITLARTPDGWLIMLAAARHAEVEIAPVATGNGIELPVLEVGHVVVVSDPDRGTDLLVGTTRQDGQAMIMARHGDGYVLGPTLLGVTVERLSDQLDLRPDAAGFLLTNPVGTGPLGSASNELAVGFSRSLDLADAAVPELQRRYKAALVDAAAAPVAARRGPRLDAAEAALGLGLGSEAGVLARVASEDSPGRADEARALFIRAAASVLVGDPAARQLLADARIENSDEVELWRGLDLARREPHSSEAARIISARLRLLCSYPQPLRQQILGDAALALVSGGAPAARALVDGLKGDARVELAQAIRAKDQPADADPHKPTAIQSAPVRTSLDRFDRLAADRDPVVAVRAVQEAVKLRLDRNLLTPGQAADRLEAETLDARMAGQELALRLQVASLRARQRDWPAALSEMRDLIQAFPDDADRLRGVAGTMLEQMAAPTANGSPATPVDVMTQLTLLEGSQDLVPGGAAGARIAIDLAARLARLDLPDRAAVFLGRTISQAGSTDDRARLGVELAQLQLDQNNASAAQAALDDTEAAGLPTDLGASRAVLRAKLLAAAGDADGALRMLAPLHGRDADDLRIQELAAKHDWMGEADALSSLVATTLSPSGPLDGASEDLVLRLAGAVAHAGQSDALRRLDALWSPRFADPARRDMLRLLTASQVTAVGDLARSADDLAATRQALSVLQPAQAGSGS